MFESFFPRPKLFLWSGIAWFAVSLAIWYGGAQDLLRFSLVQEAAEVAEGERPPFLSQERVWLYQYLLLMVAVFCVVWFFIDRNRWYWWSVVGSAFILVITYFQVQVTVWLNEWYGSFYDLIQLGLSAPNTITIGQYNAELASVFKVLGPYVPMLALITYFTTHYVFRWRTAMNDYYASHWSKLRTVEGAAQRVQEDTMRFAVIVEGLGSALIGSIMTLIAFLPLLWTLSAQVTELPIVGQVDGSMVFLALISSIFGTVLLAIVGVRLPGLEFNNQKVEAAYRKELVYGEDDSQRASPPALADLFHEVRRNYFRLYFNFLYFNVFRYAYLNVAQFVPFLALGPTVVAGAITFGVFQQILNAFNRVEGSFQYLVSSWVTIVELMSIHKRLMAFESRIGDGMAEDPAEPALQL